MIPIRDTIPSRNAPLVTWTLIAINVSVFLYELTLGPAQLEHFVYTYGIVPARFTHPRWAHLFGLSIDKYWPLLTSIFVHGGWAHIIGNMWALWIFGDNVEDRLGRLRFLIFYLLTGLAAGIAHWMSNPNSTVPTVGASGAIAGVLGAYFVLFPFSRIIVLFPVLFFPLFFEVPAVTYILFWFLSQLLGGTLSGFAPGGVGGIAWWAHVGGFAAGMGLSRIFLISRRNRPRRFQPDEYGIEGAWHA